MLFTVGFRAQATDVRQSLVIVSLLGVGSPCQIASGWREGTNSMPTPSILSRGGSRSGLATVGITTETRGRIPTTSRVYARPTELPIAQYDLPSLRSPAICDC
jgi:hypothetical protein